MTSESTSSPLLETSASFRACSAERAMIDAPDDAIRDRCEQTIRNYDPCISCSTHFLKLSVTRA